jgi:iron complex transport system permease protein
VVAIAGIVGWIGLLIPHVARRLTGADARRALPAAIFLGGIFVLLCDDLSRTLLAGEIPLGILASFFGALLFMAMMLSKNIRVQR